MKKLVYGLVLVFLIIVSGCGVADTVNGNENNSVIEVENTITLTEDAQNYAGKIVDDVVVSLQEAGFTNVKKEAIDDLTSADSAQDNTIQRVEIDGNASFVKGDIAKKESEIIIFYHRLLKIKFPRSQEEIKDMKYLDAAKLLIESGFTNIATNEIYDLNADAEQFTKAYIKGLESWDAETEIPFDTEILLEGHYAVDRYQISINIDFPGNWLFNKYDVDVNLEGFEGRTLKHGESAKFQYELSTGSYKLIFKGKTENQITGEVRFEVTQSADITYRITCNADNIAVQETSMIYTAEIEKNQIALQYSSDYYIWKNYEECVKALENEGFSNIELLPTTEHLWGKTPVEKTVEISISGKTEFMHRDVFDKDAKVIVSYHIPTAQFIEERIVAVEQDVFPLEYTVSDEIGAQNVTIKILHDAVLEETENNLYLAKREGYTDVLLKYKDVVLDDCRVQINKKIIPIETVTFEKDTIEIAVGTQFQLNYTIAPSDANYLDITKNFAGDSIQEMETGELYAAAAGETVITFYQDERRLAEVKIIAVDVPVEEIAFENEEIVVGFGRTQEIKFMTTPANASNIRLSVETKNEKIATAELDQSGEHIIKITGVKIGETSVKITSIDGAVVEKKVTVCNVLPESISVVAPTEKIAVGQTGNFSVQFDPVDTTQQKVTWSSSNAKVLKVDKNGGFTAVKAGSATVTATHKCGVQGVLNINVVPIDVSGLEITSNWDEQKEFKRNDKMKLTAKVYPENATDKTVKWSSSNSAVATVSGGGEVKAISDGTAIITATSHNGITASYTVEVALSPQKFKITVTLTKKSTNHVGNNWSKGFEFNGESIKSGSTVSIMPGEEFTVCAWARENDSSPDYGHFYKKITLTREMCISGFAFEDEFYVTEDRGRYSGSSARWYVKIKFTPVG